MRTRSAPARQRTLQALLALGIAVGAASVALRSHAADAPTPSDVDAVPPCGCGLPGSGMPSIPVTCPVLPQPVPQPG